MAHDVFISYSTKDKAVVEKLALYLEQNGIRCWIAYKDIPVGRDWADFIPQAIKDCKMMVYVHSSRSNPSKEIDKEIALSLKGKHPILPFKIEDVEYSGSKAYHLATINWIDAFPNPEKCFGQLLSNIRGIFYEIETGDNHEINRKEKTITEQAESIKPKRNLNYLWFGLGGIIIIVLGILGLQYYTNFQKIKTDLNAYNEWVNQAEKFPQEEDYYRATLINYDSAIGYELKYADSKHADKFNSGIGIKRDELANKIDSLFASYKEAALHAFALCLENNFKFQSDIMDAKEYGGKALNLKNDNELFEIMNKLSQY
jgi:hypothetical protein